MKLPQHKTNDSQTSKSDITPAGNLEYYPFLSSVCHELKTPLNAITGFADILSYELKHEATKEECLNYVKEIIEAAEDLNEIIHDLLDINQISAETFSVDLSKKIDVCDIIRKVVRLNKCYAMKRSISMRVEILSDVQPVNLDAKRLKQIMMNLISNAIKYTKEKTEVRVVVGVVENAVEISVIDQGVGMTQDEIKVAFEKYGTIANQNHANIDSVGLGLPITRKLVELQNGIIEAISAPNQGTQMKVRFPYSA